MELALEDLLVAVAEEDDGLIDEGQNKPTVNETAVTKLRRRPRVPDAICGNAAYLILALAALIAVVIYV